MGQYNKKGMYSGYDKNHKERDALDYYSTPTSEVVNILETMHIDLDNSTILEPCCGGGHMVRGIEEYCYNYYDSKLWKIIATDVKSRPSMLRPCDYKTGLEYDFLADEYPYTEDIDYVIMNPPFSTIEPFVMKSLDIAKKGVLMFGRLQFLEGKKRYENILKDNPPSKVWVYVDRVGCLKNGTEKTATVQAYAWYYWDKINPTNTELRWIRRSCK